jgi:hypothetical protein
MRIQSVLGLVGMGMGLFASASVTAGTVSYQCAFVVQQSSYESLVFNVESSDASRQLENKLERVYELPGNSLAMTVRQLGVDQIELTMTQTVSAGGAPVVFTSSTQSLVGTGAISLHASKLPEAAETVRLACSLR